MRTHYLFFLCAIINFFLLIFPFNAIAGWQVSRPQACIPREPFFQTGVQPKKVIIPSAYSSAVFPNQYAHLGHPAAVYAVSISGSLKENLERIMSRYHWRVVWKAPYDYNFDGRVTGSSLPNVIQKLLQPFPLQAVMYMSNRTLAVVPRVKR
jgi:hypothetical protein